MVKINDVTLRDGQQSLLSGRVQQADLLKAAAAGKDLPFNMIEVWGGTCFDMPLKEKGENPFQNLREFRETLGDNANLSMLLRCQNLVGYEPHDMSIVESFVEEAAKPFGHEDGRMGVNTFRIFDSLNDTDNMAPVIKAVRKLKDDRGWNVSAQGTLSYTVVNDEQRKDVIAHGGPENLYTPEYYANMAKTLVEAGAESICIKDMAGLLDAEHAGPLVAALKEAVNVPIVLHAQSGLGLSDEAIIAAVKAGIDEIDTTSIAMSGGSGHSATETILDAIARRCPENAPEGFLANVATGRKPYLTQKAKAGLAKVAEAWRSIRPKYAAFENPYDPELQKLIQKSQVPGGMTTTLRTQISKDLKDPKDIDIFLKAALVEMANVRADVGYITLVTPSSQIVGTQAVAYVGQVFHQLKAKGELSLENVAAKIAENRESGQHLNVMTPPFAKLVLGKLGALPYSPDAELIEKAESMGVSAAKPATLSERRAELAKSIKALLNPQSTDEISEHRLTEMLQRRGQLSNGTTEKLERIADNPTAQELLMYAIKPVSTTKELQGRLYALIHQIDPKGAEKIGYGADTPPTHETSWPGKGATATYNKIDFHAWSSLVESYAQASLEKTRLEDGAIKFDDTNERQYRLDFIDETLQELEQAAHARINESANPRVEARFFADYAHARGAELGINIDVFGLTQKVGTDFSLRAKEATNRFERPAGDWGRTVRAAGESAKKDNPRFQR